MAKVALDAGHAISTPGKRSPDGTLREYEFAFDVVNRIGKYLGLAEVEVIYTRPTDADVSLDERCNIANRAGANLFMSIHADAYGNGSEWTSPEGVTVFKYLTTPNSTDIFAQNVHDELIAATGFKDRGIKRADFAVVRQTHMDAVLVEHGFYTNYAECQKLKDSAFREKIAIGDAKGILRTLGIDFAVVENKLKGEDIVKNLVIFSGLGDLGAAMELADFLHAPVMSQENYDVSKPKAEKLYVVGGDVAPEGAILLSGSSRFDTAEKVCQFIRQ